MAKESIKVPPERTTNSMEEKPAKAKAKDRSTGQYSQDDFKMLPRAQQLELANIVFKTPSEEFDTLGFFQFSRTTFMKICLEELGFETGFFDPISTETITIYLDGSSRETREKKMTLSKTTIAKIDELLPRPALTINQYSMVLDKILSLILDDLLEKKKTGHFRVVYPKTEERELKL